MESSSGVTPRDNVGGSLVEGGQRPAEGFSVGQPGQPATQPQPLGLHLRSLDGRASVDPTRAEAQARLQAAVGHVQESRESRDFISLPDVVNACEALSQYRTACLADAPSEAEGAQIDALVGDFKSLLGRSMAMVILPPESDESDLEQCGNLYQALGRVGFVDEQRELHERVASDVSGLLTRLAEGWINNHIDTLKAINTATSLLDELQTCRQDASVSGMVSGLRDRAVVKIKNMFAPQYLTLDQWSPAELKALADLSDTLGDEVLKAAANIALTKK